MLLGDGRDNVLNGRAGDDRISGRDGNDRLVGSEGTDTLRGGGGNDSLYSSDRRDALYGGAGTDTLGAPIRASRPTRRFRCGGGNDIVAGNPQGSLLVDCERVQPSGGSFSARSRGDGSVRFSWACTTPVPERCAVTASLRRGSRRVAEGRGSAHTRATRSFVLRPRPRLPRGQIVQVVAAGTSGAGRFPSRFAARWRIRL